MQKTQTLMANAPETGKIKKLWQKTKSVAKKTAFYAVLPIAAGIISLSAATKSANAQISLPTLDFKRMYAPSESFLYLRTFTDVPVEHFWAAKRDGSGNIWFPSGEVTLSHNIGVKYANAETGNQETNYFPAMYNLVLGYNTPRGVENGVPNTTTGFQFSVKFNYMESGFGDMGNDTTRGDNPDNYKPYEFGYAYSTMSTGEKRHSLNAESVLPLNNLFTISNYMGFETGTQKPGYQYKFKLSYYAVNDSNLIFSANGIAQLLDNITFPFSGISRANTGFVGGGLETIIRLGNNADQEMNKFGASVTAGVPVNPNFWSKGKLSNYGEARVAFTYGDYIEFGAFVRGYNLLQTDIFGQYGTSVGTSIKVNMSGLQPLVPFHN